MPDRDRYFRPYRPEDIVEFFGSRDDLPVPECATVCIVDGQVKGLFGLVKNQAGQLVLFENHADDLDHSMLWRGAYLALRLMERTRRQGHAVYGIPRDEAAMQRALKVGFQRLAPPS